MIRHSRPTIDSTDLKAIQGCLDSADVGDGRTIGEFEKELARAANCKYATATNSGTAALHLALLALDVREGDRVVIPSYACASLLHAVHYCRAVPVVCDVDPESYNIDADCVKKALKRAVNVKAIVAVHQFGLPCGVEEISAIGIPVVEDCAVSIGARCGWFGAISVFSFYATKMLCTGRGGAVVTPFSNISRRIQDLIRYDGRDTYDVSFNYRMPALNAALGISQMKRLPAFLKGRREIADLYFKELCNLPVGLPIKNSNVYYRFPLKAENVEALIEHGGRDKIEMKRPVYKPLHKYTGDSCPGAEEAFKKTISIPIYPSLTKPEARKVAVSIRKFLKHA